jgi:hypothetical protein
MVFKGFYSDSSKDECGVFNSNDETTCSNCNSSKSKVVPRLPQSSPSSRSWLAAQSHKEDGDWETHWFTAYSKIGLSLINSSQHLSLPITSHYWKEPRSNTPANIRALRTSERSSSHPPLNSQLKLQSSRNTTISQESPTSRHGLHIFETRETHMEMQKSDSRWLGESPPKKYFPQHLTLDFKEDMQGK